MSPEFRETLKIVLEIVGGLVTLALTIRGINSDRLRARERMKVLEQGGDPRSLPDIGPKPLLMLVAVGAVLAWLFSQHPEMAQRVLPLADSAELTASAMPTPSAASCTSAADCSKGCSCTGGQCTPCSAAKPKQPLDRKQKPRLVASMDGTLCADCMRLPQFVTAIAQPFGD